MNQKQKLEDIIRRLREIADELDGEVLWGDVYASDIDEVVARLEALQRNHDEDES